MTVAQQRWAELIIIQPATEVVGSGTYTYLKIQRELFDRAIYINLYVNQMVWSRGLNIDSYNPFIYQNSTLDSIPYGLDVITCYVNGPTIVAIRTDVRSSIEAILLALSRTQILPNRLY